MTEKALLTPGMQLAAFVTCLALSTDANAFCIARSCDPDAKDGDRCERDPETLCSIDGIELHRSSGCITVAIKEGTPAKVPGLSDAELEQIVLEGFEMWTSLDCGNGEHPAIRMQSAGVLQTADAFACREVPEQNVDMWMVSDDVSPTQVVTPTTGTVAGVTFPTFLSDSGEVFDADVKLNTLWVIVQDEQELHEQLRVVAAHEAGHVLGLSHSQDENALMYRNYTVTADRVPTADDREGICALFPPDELSCDAPAVTPAALSQRDCSRAFQQQPRPIIEGPAQEPAGCCILSVARTRAGKWSTLLSVLFALTGLVRTRSRRTR